MQNCTPSQALWVVQKTLKCREHPQASGNYVDKSFSIKKKKYYVERSCENAAVFPQEDVCGNQGQFSQGPVEQIHW